MKLYMQFYNITFFSQNK